MTGVLMSVPAVDFQLHNSLFLVAHFHNVIIGGVIFGYFAGFIYWFPKTFGFTLNEKYGKLSFWCWLIGFYIAFLPLYALGLMGMTRRIDHYSAATGWHPYLVIAAVGAAIIALGITFQMIQLLVSLQERTLSRASADPWGGRTLEWSIPSPPPFYNFALLPIVNSRDAFWEMKQARLKNGPPSKPTYKAIHMPKNTGTGFMIAMFSAVFGFAMVWHMWILVILGLLGILGTIIVRTLDTETDYYLTPEEVEKIEQERWKTSGFPEFEEAPGLAAEMLEESGATE